MSVVKSMSVFSSLFRVDNVHITLHSRFTYGNRYTFKYQFWILDVYTKYLNIKMCEYNMVGFDML